MIKVKVKVKIKGDEDGKKDILKKMIKDSIDGKGGPGCSYKGKGGPGSFASALRGTSYYKQVKGAKSAARAAKTVGLDY